MVTTGEAVDGALVEQLRSRFRGDLLQPGDAGYDERRTNWSGMISRMPALTARCTGAADVMAAVTFARQNDLLVSVRGGGHSVAGFSTCDGGLMIDLLPMKGIRVDLIGRTVRAEPGLTWGKFDRETQAFGLATTGGTVTSTGIAGLTLGGGLGFLMRRYGLACDNLLLVDIVTADGEFRHASATENADLFWGLRGGGGNFGIVTSFEYRLHEVGPTVLGGLFLHPFSAATEFMRFYREFTATAPDDLTVYLACLTMPDGDPLIGFAVCYSGPLDRGEEIVRPLRAFGSPIDDSVRQIPYIEMQALNDPLFPPGRLNYWKSSFVHDLSDAAIDTMIAHFETVPSSLSVIALEQMGGAVSWVDPNEMAFSERSAPYSFIIASQWTDPADSGKNIRWTRDCWEAMRPFESEAAYVNYLGAEEHDRIRSAYGAEKYERLVALKDRYDPTNLFRLNQNIAPDASR